MELTAWACRTCNRVDWRDSEANTAWPQHFSYRGVDKGTCQGNMVPLFREDACVVEDTQSYVEEKRTLKN